MYFRPIAVGCIGTLLFVAPVYAVQHGRSSGAAPVAHGNGKAAPAPTPSHTTQTNPIAAKIAAKPQLNVRIATMLPKGMTLEQASKGFKNQGQFIAALHVSQNLGIPFASLKKDMVGKHLSLGQSIQDLKPTVHSADEARRGQIAADHDLDDSKK
jgi:hypothetical protein